MLDRLLLEQKIAKVFQTEKTWVQDTFDQMLTAWYSIQSACYEDFRDSQHPIAQWIGSLNNFTQCTDTNPPYTIYGIDGSQIYPDRHFGLNIALINIGYAGFVYGNTKSTADLGSVPTLYARQDLPTPLQAELLSEGTTDALRTMHEFAYALAIAERNPDLIIFDGSLIFWHLGTPDHPAPHADYFLKAYLSTLSQLAEHNTPFASYISSPKSRDLTGLIAVKHPQLASICYGYTDADILQHILPKNNSTPVFRSTAPITAQYPEQLRPHFLYLNIEGEIGRLEFPAFVAQNDKTLQKLVTYITNQITKGKGYPIALAESHEQAVIREHDRQFVLQRLAKQSTQFQYSKKQLHKQRPII